MKMTMKILKSVLIIMVLACLAASASAQGKIGIIDLRKVFDDYYKTKSADALLKDHAADLDKQRKSLMDQYQKATDDYKKALDDANNQAVSSDEREKRKKSAESTLLDIKRMEDQIGQFDRTARATLDEQQRSMRDRILDEIRTVVNAKAKAGHYSLVLDTASESINKTPIVLYNDGENDITAAVLSQLNIKEPTNLKPADKNEKSK
jgi:outer membrane protein